jgi:hypothetical protein
MSLKKNIIKIAGQKLKEYGFNYTDHSSLNNIWRFEKIMNDEKQFIDFQSSSLEKAFFIIFSTTMKIRRIYGCLLFDGFETNYKWRYNNNDEMLSVINKVTELTIEYGIPYLNSAIIPDLEPTLELHKQLLINPLHEAERFSDMYRISFKEKKVVKKIELIILDIKMNSTNDQDNWRTMLQASAFLGEHIRYNFGGEWLFNELDNYSYITNIGGINKIKAYPFNWVARFWGKHDVKVESISHSYGGILELLGKWSINKEYI